VARRAGAGAGLYIVVRPSCSPFPPREQLLTAAVGVAVVAFLPSRVFRQLGVVVTWQGGAYLVVSMAVSLRCFVVLTLKI
jgi:hypothetical protein